jgi:hypothetical protein
LLELSLWRKKASGSGSGLSLKAALDYGRLGWSVIPVEPSGKRPMLGWQVYQYRRAEVPEIAEWFQRWPEANIAIVTGIVSGLVVLDLDPRHGVAASLEQLKRAHRSLPDTVEASTGGGGRHLYFAHPGEVTRNRVGLLPGIDLRGDGGYVVAPPSVHGSGEAYRWVRSPEVLHPVPLPLWLLQQPAGETSPQGHPLSYWRRLLRDGVAEGARNDSIASLAGHLLRHGVDPQVVTELLLTWNGAHCRPPLAEAEVVRTVESIARIHQRQGEEGGLRGCE